MSISSYQCFWGLPVENCFLVSQTTFNFTCQIVQKERPDIQAREVTFMSRLWCKRNPDNKITYCKYSLETRPPVYFHQKVTTMSLDALSVLVTITGVVQSVFPIGPRSPSQDKGTVGNIIRERLFRADTVTNTPREHLSSIRDC